MKSKNTLYAAAILMTVFGCRSDKVVPDAPAPPVSVQEDKPFAPDSVLSYVPVLGNASQVRQFPFGPAGRPDTSVRLVEFTDYSDRRKVEYRTVFQYDQAGRLAQWTRYNKDSLIYSRHSYAYDAGGKISVKVEKNQSTDIAELFYVYLKNNDLEVSYLSSFEPTAGSNVLLSRTDDVKTPFFIQTVGITHSRLSFGTDGQLVREDVLSSNGENAGVVSSRIFKRNETGNIAFIHLKSAKEERVEYYTYDDKPNPYRTTGDVMLLKDLIPGEMAGVSNINNVLIAEVFSKNGNSALHYVYEYRPDGYPFVMRSFYQGELTNTREFVYSR